MAHRVTWPRGVFAFIKVSMMIANDGQYSLFMSLSSIKIQDDHSCVFKVRNKNMSLATKVISSHHHLKVSKFQSRKFSRHIIPF